ncbi:hypothetical protein [Nocardioides sp.]|uniref:hypothetical protein n=1 Tax=Nocardioides sp. TaxID=35761 RepID=UPI0039E41445
MIVEWLMDVLQAGLLWVASLLPEDPWTVYESWSLVLAHMADLNYYLPISELFAFTIGAFVVFPAFAGVSLVLWLVGLIRGASVRG